jgi:type VI secretion system protein ImpC
MAEETSAAAAAGSTDTSAQSGSLLERILSEGRLAREDAESQKHARDLLQEFIDQTSKGLKIDEKTKDTVRAIE